MKKGLRLLWENRWLAIFPVSKILLVIVYLIWLFKRDTDIYGLIVEACLFWFVYVLIVDAEIRIGGRDE